MPPGKWIDFFADEHWSRGVSWYERQFERVPPGVVAVGEASNRYSHHPLERHVPARIAAVVPDARLVYVVRQPIERIESHYRQAVAEWGERRPIDEVVLADEATYLSPSCYALQLDRYLDHFDRGQILVVHSNDLREATAATLGRVFEFIGVSSGFLPDNVAVKLNKAIDYRRQSHGVRALRRSSAYRAVRRFVPSRLRKRAWRAATKPLDYDPGTLRLTGPTRQAVVDYLLPDLERLRSIVGPQFDAWGWLESLATDSTSRH